MNNNNKNITDEDLSSERKNVMPTNEYIEKNHNLSSESYSSSEFEFNFKKHITDDFEIKNRGLFKLSFENQTNSKLNFINGNENIIGKSYKNYSKNDNINNDIVQPAFLVEDRTENINENKDEIITKLKKEINLLTKKLEEKSKKIENVQKDNFQLEQIYKNKYYTDIKKEKKKVIDTHSKNRELIRKLNYYSESFHQLKQKIQHLKNIFTLIQCVGSNENLNVLFNNMKDISVIIESIESKIFQENKSKPKEKNERIKIQKLENVKNENKKKEKNNFANKLCRSISSSHNNHKFTSNYGYATKEKEKLENTFVNKEINFLRDNLFLNCYKRINNRKKSLPNSPIKKKYLFENYDNLRKVNNVNSKKKYNRTNLSIHTKEIPLQTSDNILNLFRETRKIHYLLRNSLNIKNYKRTSSQKRNVSNRSYKKSNIKRSETGEYTFKNKSNDSIKYNSSFKKETLNNSVSKEIKMEILKKKRNIKTSKK